MHLTPDNYRQVTLVLLDTEGTPLGELPPIRLEQPWLQETGALVTHCASELGLDIAVLRLLAANDSQRPEIQARYLAQLLTEPDTLPLLKPEDWQDVPDANRPAYASVGGPANDLAWARSAIAGAGFGDVTSYWQQRSWNLSAIWRIQTADNTFWLKHVPDFYAHESSVIQLLPDEVAPSLVAASANRTLMRNIEGEDAYDASLDQVLHMVTTLVDLQASWSTRLDDLIAVGVPDQRGETLIDFIVEAIEKNLDNLASEYQATLIDFVNNLPDRLTELERCGLPTSLVHADFHPGNWRGNGLDLTILDWGDCIVGHPLFDVPALLRAVPREHRQAISDHWCSCWRQHAPDADIERALELSAPIANARIGAVYQLMLENIEVSECIYHLDDPEIMFVKTAQMLENAAP